MHVLSTPPAFILSQNRTLHKKTMRKAKNRLSQNKIDGRLIRKGDSHENPDPHQPPSRTPPQDNQTPRTEAGTGLAIIDYKRSSTDTLLSSQTTTTHPTKPTPQGKPAGERQQENNIHHQHHPRKPTTQPPPHKPYKTHANTGVSKTPHTTHQNTQTNQPNTKTTPKTRRLVAAKSGCLHAHCRTPSQICVPRLFPIQSANVVSSEPSDGGVPTAHLSDTLSFECGR